MNKKSLLEQLKDLTPSFKSEKEDDDIDLKDASLKDGIEDDDKYLEDEEDSYEKQELEDEEEDEHEDEDEEGEDLDGDGEDDNVHALFKMKDAFDASDDDLRHAIVMFTRIILDTGADAETLEKFLDDVDMEDEEGEYEDEEEDDSFEDEFMEPDREDDMEDDEDMEDEEEDSKSKEESFEDEEFGEFKNNLYESVADQEMFEADRETYFTNEALISDDYDMYGMLD